VTLRRATLSLLALCLALVFGCEDTLPRASEIKHMRVLGAVTELAGDATRSTPKPAETATVTWSMAYPDVAQDDSELASMFATCTAPTRFSGQPVCQELLDAAQGSNLTDVVAGAAGLRGQKSCADMPDQRIEAGPFSLTCVTGTPHSDVKVEPSYKAAAKLVQGIICRNGSPTLDVDDPTGVRCEPHKGVKASLIESIPVYGTVPVQYKNSDLNQNPSLDAATFSFGESELSWPTLTFEESAVLADDCAAAAVDGQVLSSNGKDEQITIEYDAAARELHDKEPEALEFSTYVTIGELDRRFTVFASDAKPPLKSTLKWTISKEQRDKLGDKSQLVRFYFTVLDHRGGFAITRRELCLGRDLTKN
jgi:hypothetical protein